MRPVSRVTLVLGLAIVALCAGAVRATTGQLRTKYELVSAGRLDRLERWLKAVDQHAPGVEDEAVVAVGSWSVGELRDLWIDANVLVQLMRNPGGSGFSVRAEGQAAGTEIRHTAQQFRRLRVLACVARAAATTDLRCPASGAESEIDAALSRLSARAAAAKRRGDDNYILRRGALLHTDIAIDPRTFASSSFSAGSSAGPVRFKLRTADGREIDLKQTAGHWEIARMLLDQVQPGEADKPAPGRDAMVRQWYRATAAWMQYREDHDTVHLQRARALFPADPDILFLSGSQHETYAGPLIQSALATAALPTGVFMDAGDGRGELRQAEAFFRRTLEVKPDHVEARVRHGRVLARLGRHAEAAAELRQALSASDDPLVRFYAELFLGAEEEALGHLDVARAQYESAAARYPRAQSALLAVSQLARRMGDRPGALRALQQAFELERDRDWHEDPWWGYYVVQGRDADALLVELRKPFRAEDPR